MKANRFLSLMTGKIKTLKKPSLSIANIKAVIQSYIRQKKMILGFSLATHIYEQIIWRRTQVATLSPECWESGHCKVCGCEILGKTIEDRGCSAPEVQLPACYPDMMTKEVWEYYKTTNNIKLF